MNLSVQKVHLPQFLSFEAGYFSPIARYHAYEAERLQGAIFCAYLGTEVAGLCIIYGGTALDVAQLVVQDHLRRQGIGQKLLSEARDFAEKSGKQLTFRIILGNKNSDSYQRVGESCGLKVLSTATLLIFDPRNRGKLAAWYKIQAEHLQPILHRLEHRGYQTYAFEALPPEHLPILRTQTGAGSPFGVTPYTITDLSEKFSFATFQHNTLVGLVSCGAFGNKLVLEQLAVLPELRGTGVFLLPLTAFINAAIAHKIARVTCVFDDNNQYISKISGRFLDELYVERKQQWTMGS